MQQKISNDLKEALKSGDSFRVGVLRMIAAAFKNKEIEKKGKGENSELIETEVIDIISKEAKKRKDAVDAYASGGRSELAQQELKELDIIKKYLPAQLSAAEIEKIVDKAIEIIGVQSQKDFGKVIGEAMKELKGKADASEVSAIVKKKLEEKLK
ncbi:MAG: GatB/YqeY domain-containing protein [Patescibacteria group bacterium]